MKGRMFPKPLFLASAAAIGAVGLMAPMAEALAEPVQLAQIQADVVIGRDGERIFLDPRTGEVLAVQRPQGVNPRSLPRSAPDDGFERQRQAIRAERDAQRRAMERERQARADAIARQRAEEDAQRQRRIEQAIASERQRRRESLATAPLPTSRDDDVTTGSVSRGPLLDPPSQYPQSPGLNQNGSSSVIGPSAPQAQQPDRNPAENRQVTAKAQILLDRTGASPGAIDGLKGDNMLKAMDAYRTMTGQLLDFTDERQIDAALAGNGGEAFTDYTITAADAAGPFVASIPSDYGEKAQLDHMSYTRASEMLAEKFHMDEDYLLMLNPGVDFSRPGTSIRVANVGPRASHTVARVVADKGRKQVRAYDASGRLVVAYPATIGSSDTPSPSGTVTVERIAFDPNYTYDPAKNFKQGDNDRVLTIPPGPNGPVGSIWIALSKPTYGIHGTPDPSRIGKTSSHGCVRLTNWDATQLAKIIEPGATVEFLE